MSQPYFRIHLENIVPYFGSSLVFVEISIEMKTTFSKMKCVVLCCVAFWIDDLHCFCRIKILKFAEIFQNDWLIYYFYTHKNRVTSTQMHEFLEFSIFHRCGKRTLLHSICFFLICTHNVDAIRLAHTKYTAENKSSNGGRTNWKWEM